MSKLDGIKEKLANFKEAAKGKLDKISLLGWKKKDPADATTATGPNPYSITQMYKSGSTATRIQIFLVYVFFISGLTFAFIASKKFLNNFKSSSENENLQKDYSHGFEELNRKAMEKATLLSMGKFQAKVKIEGNDRFIGIDIWLKVSSPEAADFVRKNESKVNDKIVSAFQSIYDDSINLLTMDGKKAAKAHLKKQVDTILPKGELVDSFFENLIIQ